MIRLETVFEDDDVIVVKKPAGVATESRRIGEMDMISLVKNYLAMNGRSNPYVAMVHRLDQPVEGLLVFAKTKSAAAALSKQMGEAFAHKEYTAVVYSDSEPSSEPVTLVDWLLKEPKGNSSKVVSEGMKGAKRAELEYRCEEALGDGKYRLRIKLITGRHHQIRLQLSNAHMPIVGDRKYGKSGDTARKLELCASHLEFKHPKSGEKIVLDFV